MESSAVLLALATGAFAIGTTEFTPMGLLTVIANGVDVDIPAAGLLVSAYAMGVMVGAPVMTLLFSRFGKRNALMALMVLFTIGNLLSALAPSFTTLLLSRLVTSLNHGAFFGIGAVVAASGVPIATWLGLQLGWRLAFGATAALGLLTIAALWLTLPKGAPGTRPNVRSELKVLMARDVLIAMGTTVFGAGAMFTLYTYVTPLLEDMTNASPDFVTFALVLIGIGFTMGNSLGGKQADWSLEGATQLILAALALIMLVLPLAFQSHIGAAIALVIWGAASFANRATRANSGDASGAQSAGPGLICECRRLQPRQCSGRRLGRLCTQPRLGL
nr:MFS transporter [Lampropedia aestuarii]